MLVEALMELLLLANAQLVVAAMMSNLPRLALLLRVTPPGESTYVSLDERKWCTLSSCRRTIRRRVFV